MEKNESYHLGKVIKVYGKNGKLVITCNYPDSGFVQSLKFLFIDIGNRLIPFHITGCEAEGDFANIILEDIDTPEKARELIKREVYIPLKEIPTRVKDEINIHMLANYRVEDLNHGEIGIITSFIEGPKQTILKVFRDGREILIPFAEGIVREINTDKMTIVIDAPEGLIELNET